jgi:hypothetical protein
LVIATTRGNPSERLAPEILFKLSGSAGEVKPRAARCAAVEADFRLAAAIAIGRGFGYSGANDSGGGYLAKNFSEEVERP